MEQRRFKGVSDLSNQRHLEDAKRLRKEAQGTPAGVEREKLLRMARQAEAAARMQEWPKSSGIQAQD